MKERWLPVGILAGALFVVNIVARLIVRFAAGGDEGKQTWIGMIALVSVGLVVLVAAVRWVRRFPMPRALGELALAAAVGCLLSATIGPFVSSGKPFGGGAGYFVGQLFYYLAVCSLGAMFGALGVMAAGADQKSQSWKRYAETVQARPRRVVRGR